ncbi:MAG TPA: hypothetical protein VJ023_18015 [Pyrinomonadaceae bacterium]|nr:hypothetical protein [Pyrinomonadaceae bacterium]
MTGTIDPAQKTTAYEYNARSQMTSVTDVFGQVVSYQYDANSNRSQLSLNGATNATYQYDLIDRLTQLTDNTSVARAAWRFSFSRKLSPRILIMVQRWSKRSSAADAMMASPAKTAAQSLKALLEVRMMALLLS